MSALVETDVVIIGGGIVGASAALFLRRRGMEVALIERDYCGSRSSGVNFGGVRRQGRPLIQLPLAQRAHAIWNDLPGHIGIDGELVRSGHLKLARSDEDMRSLERYEAETRGFDMGLELLGEDDIRRRYPWVGKSAVGASLCPADGHANPRLISPAFAVAAKRLGAHVYEQTPVVRVEDAGDDFLVTAGDGLRFRAPWLLNCAGAWAAGLALQYGEPVPMRAGHPAMLVTEPLPVFMTCSTGVEGGGIYARQVARGNCVIGGGQGFALDDRRARVDQQAVVTLLRQATTLFPSLHGAHVIRTWSGTEGYLPDRQPVIGFSRMRRGLVHGFGFAGGGFQIGPAVGDVLAELVCEGASRTPIEPFSIQRFQHVAA
ncbi:NAD(P)/FAD-dependent oxidoreductase [Pseudomonas matsuisoli]|uniref:FAD-binding oxidoreductase n=1 Tax=Pseudomonas matsuisoli TaxID=1515666 RepID=A0A917Q0A9_9PSED|nr:FAD-binding oxidoreductase [Pseudomonas matsuisoli]GGK04706.1 FAD-binding oxidoreductase [Pseudomonas matsuisoli]